jgi:hypothetical protein
MRAIQLAIIGLFLWFGASQAVAENPQYTLFTNTEHHGILIFPKENLFPDLRSYLETEGFKETESGEAVMRSDAKRENMTYMMPEAVQKKHGIEKFITLQVLDFQGILVGIFHPEWGLTLPFATFSFDDVKKKIPQTLEAFRGRTQPPQHTQLNNNAAPRLRWACAPRPSAHQEV